MPKKFKQFLSDVHEQRMHDHGEGIIKPDANFTYTPIPKLRPDTPNQERNQRRLKRDAHAAQLNFQLAADRNASAPAAQPEPKKQDTGVWATIKALGGGLADLLRREDLNVSEVDALSEQQTQMEETNMGIREKLLAVLHEDRAQHNKGAVPAESHDEKEKSSKGATEMKQPAKDAAADPVDIVSQGHEDASKAGRVTAPAPGRNSADGVRSGDQQIIPSATPQKALASTMEAYKSMYAPVEEEVSEESVELEERSLSPAEKKAMKELIAKAIGARQPYLDAIIRDKGLKGEVLSNGDFIVKGKNGKVEGRIAKGKFDPSVIGESVEVSEESVELDEDFRALAKKGIGAEHHPDHKHGDDTKVGRGVDYYHPKTTEKREGKIVKVGDTHYHVKDEKTGEIHKFAYYNKD